ncbi:MAG TPA: hypothetical protein ENG46_00235 [Acidilobales archaeon]|nr:hypothetical protein [Acidilobales archaeon]
MSIKILREVFAEKRTRFLLCLLLIFVLMITTYYLGYNLVANSIVYGTLMISTYNVLIRKPVKDYKPPYISIRIWIPIVFLMYVGMFFGLLYSTFHYTQSIKVLEEVGKEIIKLKSPEKIFLFNLVRGIFAVIPYIGPFIIGIALGNSGFLIGIALKKLLVLEHYKDFVITLLIPFHPYGFLELLSYGFFLTASLYIRLKHWKYSMLSISVAIVLLFIAAHLEIWEMEVYSYGV